MSADSIASGADGPEEEPGAPDSPELSVVVPTYRGADSLGELCARVAAMARAQGLRWEMWVVDDASPDHTAQVMPALLAAEPRIHYLRLTHNHGQHAATVKGLALSRAPVVVTMDDDLQQAPESIPRLLAALSGKVQVVIARFPDPAHPLWRQLGSRWVQAWARPGRGPARLTITSFKAFRREAAASLVQAVPEHGRFYLSAVLQTVVPPQQIINVDVPHFQRKHGSSSYGPSRLVRLAWRALRGRQRSPTQ